MKDAEFEIISLNDNAVLVEGKLYNKNEVVKTILTDIEGVASTSADLLPYGKYRIEESKAPEGYLTDGANRLNLKSQRTEKSLTLQVRTLLFTSSEAWRPGGCQDWSWHTPRVLREFRRITSKTR